VRARERLFARPLERSAGRAFNDESAVDRRSSGIRGRGERRGGGSEGADGKLSLDVSSKVRERPLTVDVEFYGSHRVSKRDLSWQKRGRGRGIEEKWWKRREGVRGKEGGRK